MSEQEKKHSGGEEIPASFTSLILNLAATALLYLGKPLTPDAPGVEVNPTLAQHTIDTMEILKTKTEGNRTPEETELLNDLIYQLRILYLQTINRPTDQRP